VITEHEQGASGKQGRSSRVALRLAWALVRVLLLVALGATTSTFVYEQF